MGDIAGIHWGKQGLLFTPGNTCKISHLALDNTVVYPSCRFPWDKVLAPGENTCKISHLALDNTDLVYPRGILPVFPEINKVSVV